MINETIAFAIIREINGLSRLFKSNIDFLIKYAKQISTHEGIVISDDDIKESVEHALSIYFDYQSDINITEGGIV